MSVWAASLQVRGWGCSFFVSLRDGLLTSPGCVPARRLPRHQGKATASPDPQTLFIRSQTLVKFSIVSAFSLNETKTALIPTRQKANG